VKQLEMEKEAIENAQKGNNSKSQTLTPYNQPKTPSAK